MSTGYASIPRVILHDETVSAGAKIVYVVLSSYVGAADTAWPSHATIAKLAGISVSSVQRHLAELRKDGLITWDQKFTVGQTSNVYRLLDPTDRYGSTPGQIDRPPRSQGPTPPVTVTDERTSMNVPQKKNTSEGFAEFWMLYPKKVEKKAAEAKWKTVTRTVDLALIMAGLERYLTHIRAKGTELQYVKGPAVWLNKGCWEDVYDTVPARVRSYTETPPPPDRDTLPWGAVS